MLMVVMMMMEQDEGAALQQLIFREEGQLQPPHQGVPRVGSPRLPPRLKGDEVGPSWGFYFPVCP